MTAEPKVYLIDDEAMVLAAVEAVLKLQGYAPICFNSAEEFFRQLPENCCGCVVSDLHMPGTNGIDVYNRLAALDSCLSLVIVTGVADLGATVRLAKEGAITLLEKPYHSSDIIDAVKRGIARSQSLWEQR